MEIHRKDGEIENRPKSIGGKIFDASTYGGIAGIGTFLVTIPIANLFKEGAKFHHIDQGMRGFFQKMGASKALADKSTEVTHLMHGGNLMLLPVAIMEYFRTPIVNGLNRMFNDPTDPKSVEDAPPQTFASILKARVIAWMTVFAGFWGTEKVLGTEKYEGALDKAGQKWANFRGRTPGTQAYKESYDVGHTSALDALATASSATMLYIGSHAFAKRDAEKRVHRGENPRRAHSAAAEQTTTDDTTPGTPVSATEKPAATISHVQRESAITTPEQPTLAAL